VFCDVYVVFWNSICVLRCVQQTLKSLLLGNFFIAIFINCVVVITEYLNQWGKQTYCRPAKG